MARELCLSNESSSRKEWLPIGAPTVLMRKHDIAVEMNVRGSRNSVRCNPVYYEITGPIDSSEPTRTTLNLVC